MKGLARTQRGWARTLDPWSEPQPLGHHALKLMFVVIITFVVEGFDGFQPMEDSLLTKYQILKRYHYHSHPSSRITRRESRASLLERCFSLSAKNEQSDRSELLQLIR